MAEPATPTSLEGFEVIVRGVAPAEAECPTERFFADFPWEGEVLDPDRLRAEDFLASL